VARGDPTGGPWRGAGRNRCRRLVAGTDEAFGGLGKQKSMYFACRLFGQACTQSASILRKKLHRYLYQITHDKKIIDHAI
jgi:hypothetical protein